MRLGTEPRIESLEYGQARDIGGVRLSLHPAGHIRGSAQVRLEHRGQVTVVSGDFKCDADPTCSTFEPIQCNTFVTESTFGLPIYRWPDSDSVLANIEAWWRQNQEAGKASVLYAYALGKAQRILASIDSRIGPIYTHGAVGKVCGVYRASGIELPETEPVVEAPADTDWSRALIVAPPSAHASPWLRRFRRISTAIVSGWMRVRGIRRRRSVDRGFIMSDHADWSSLIKAIEATRAPRVLTTHGYSATLARYLCERGIDARPIETQFRGEMIEDDADNGVDE
jgi:putative mRNA 3-end processing factor